MIDFSGLNDHRFDSGSLLPFHSSSRVSVRRTVRRMVRASTTAYGRSNHTTVSARSQTISRTAE